jgi:predicted Zn-dependent peptidase
VLPGRGATSDASIETVTFQPNDLAPALELLFTKATTSVGAWPSQDTLNRLMTALHAGIDAASEKANQAFQRALFGDHPLSHVVDTADLGKVTRSEVDSWIGRVYNVRNAALIVVGDVDPEDVYEAAASLSRKFNAPAWLADVPASPPPVLRPAGKEHVSLVVTPRRGALTEVRLGCLLPRMTAADRNDYALLRLAMKERLATSLRFERGDSYDLDVAYDWLRGGVAALQIVTFLDANDLSDGLSVMHESWRRWGQAGFDGGELNAGRWELVGERTMSLGSNDGIAYHLFKDWSGDPQAVGKDTFRFDPLATRPARLAELFATCRANAVLGLTGNEAAIREALAKAWPEAK